MSHLALILVVMLGISNMQEESRIVLDVGRVTYNTEIVSEPDIERLQGLVQQVIGFIGIMCSCPPGNPQDFGWSIKVIPYAEFEEFVLERLDRLEDKSYMAEGIRGNTGIIDGITVSSGGKPATYFYQWPSDSLLVHELMHVAFPFDSEEMIYRKQTEFLVSRYYKDWLTRNH